MSSQVVCSAAELCVTQVCYALSQVYVTQVCKSGNFVMSQVCKSALLCVKPGV